ncbi:MAG TPA: response regulator transcription factor [Verrucomicrobiae bacterium]|jgi:DNA-binding NarL/FixJ family response regulator|nr:response regulator transcription factor [Verrucomicrobiae bacterium]
MKAKAKTAASAKKRILIVDDHPMMREGLAQLVNSQTDLTACGEAGDAMQGLDQVKALRPDMVLADITLPGRNGLEFIKDILALAPALTVLVISMHDESLYAERVLRAGGRGYIMKQEGGKKILEAIRQVASGKIYLSEKMSAQILEVFSGRRGESGGESKVETLTDREFEVFQLIGLGLGTKEMARRLNLSAKTVDVHRANIKAKLKLASMPELIRYAVRWVESEGPSRG